MPPVPPDVAVVAQQRNAALGGVFARWYFPTMAVVMIVMAVVGFAPSIVNPSQRNGPMTLLLAVHGILFFLWLLLFLLQTTLIAARRTDLHRRMGIVAVVLLVALVPLSYIVTVQMVRRGFDLSGDQLSRSHPDALFGSIFNFFAIVEFPRLGRHCPALQAAQGDPQASHAFCEHSPHGTSDHALSGSFRSAVGVHRASGVGVAFSVRGRGRLLNGASCSSADDEARNPSVSRPASSGYRRQHCCLASLRCLASALKELEGPLILSSSAKMFLRAANSLLP